MEQAAAKLLSLMKMARQQSLAYREYDIISKNPGWAELDTDEVIGKCFEVIRESASAIKPGTVKGMGISSQGEAFTLIDKEGKALCNALVSSDIRANESDKAMDRQIRGGETVQYYRAYSASYVFTLQASLDKRKQSGYMDKSLTGYYVLKTFCNTGWG